MKLLRSIVLLSASIFSIGAQAQDRPYRDASNPYYWKNKKPFEGYWQQDVAYVIKASVNDQTDIVSGDQLLTYYNNSPDTLRFVYMHLYQNAFIKGGYLEQLNLANQFKQRFGRYETEGKGTEIELIEQQGIGTLNYEVDFSIMKVLLKEPVLPNGSITLHIRFKTYFDDGGSQRRRMKMFKDDWGNKQYDGVHWYPRMCVYDRKFGWETDQHLGKEFYGDFGSYDVELTFPNHYIVDATGVLMNQEEVLPDPIRKQLDLKNFKDKPLNEKPSVIIEPNGTTKTWKFKSINTHDFAWVADPTFRIGEEVLELPTGERVSCIALAQEPHARGWQDAAKFTSKIINVYSRDFGTYAYPKMIVADARDGMEYPMLTLDNGVSPGYYGLLAHEVGHNWFFGMVGNNETYRACLDEGFTQFLTNWSMTALFGEVKPSKKQPYPMSRMDQTVYWGYLRDAMQQQDAPLNTHSDDFGGALHHGGGYSHMYYKTATMLYNLQYVLGDSLFLGAMQHYFNQWKMCHPYIEDFRASIIQYSKTDLNWFFDQWFETTKRIDYAVSEVELEQINYKEGSKEERSRIYEIEFKRKGEMQMPIDFTIVLKDSSIRNYTIPNTYFAKQELGRTILPIWRGWGKLNPEYEVEIELPAGSQIKEVKIDPTYRLADVNQLNNSSKCPIVWSYDDLRRDPIDRKAYHMLYRPDIWYNSIDGIKLGANISGHYVYNRHVFNATVWYNTLLAQDYSGTNTIPLNARLTYRDQPSRFFTNKFELRSLDGLQLWMLGTELLIGKGTLDIYIKGFYRNTPSHIDYILYTNQWQAEKINQTVNLDYSIPYGTARSNGSLKLAVRTSFLSDYHYSRAQFQWLNHLQLARFELHSRVFAQVMNGSRIAPESALNLAGANQEELMENKWIRSRGFVPTDWLGYGNNVNHFHAGGGLNIRGYAGYLIPQNVGGSQVYLFSGNNGAAVNLELDMDKWINWKPRYTQRWLHVDAYLFSDAGMIQSRFAAGEYGLSKPTMATSNIMISSGIGAAFTIKRWWNYDMLKPFTLRVDAPLFLNNTPFADGSYTRLRWIVGINRSF